MFACRQHESLWQTFALCTNASSHQFVRASSRRTLKGASIPSTLRRRRSPAAAKKQYADRTLRFVVVDGKGGPKMHSARRDTARRVRDSKRVVSLRRAGDCVPATVAHR